MANGPPQNNFPPSSIPSGQLPPGFSPSLQNHQQGTPPPLQPYGIKQNILSNSPQLGVPAPIRNTNNSGLHSSNSSPAFNMPAMPPNSVVPPYNQVLPSRPIFSQQGQTPQFIPTTSIVRPPMNDSGNIPSTISNFNQYPPNSGLENSDIKTSLQQPWPQHVKTNIPSSQQLQGYSSGPSLINGPSTSMTSMGQPPTSMPPSGHSSGVRSNIPPASSQYGPSTSQYAPSSQYGPPFSSVGSIHPSIANNTATNGQIGTSIPESITSHPAAGPSEVSANSDRAPFRPLGPSSGPGNSYIAPPIGQMSHNLGESAQQGLPSGPPLSSNVANIGVSIGQSIGHSSRPPGHNFGQPQGSISGPSTSRPFPQQQSQGHPISSQPLPGSTGPLNGGQTGPPIGIKNGSSGLQAGQQAGSFGSTSGPNTLGRPSGPNILGPLSGPNILGNPSGPNILGPPSGSNILGPLSGPNTLGSPSGPHTLGPPSGPHTLGPSSGPNTYTPTSQSSMSSRYPQNPQQQSYNQAQLQGLTNYNKPQMQGLTNQMGQLSVAQAGFNQLWGQQMYDLLQTRHVLPEYPDDPPEIKLGNPFSESDNCSPEIFRCTVNRIPETNALLQKSRLPLGILIHPFKDLNHLPVIQCTAIVRCRACRTYINPFVYFVDSKRWKCNLCYRVNDLPEEFQYDPVSKSYGDPTRRPEIKSATIEFVAPSEYMLRPPQPAVYLFLLDVSEIACESGYLEVFCKTLKLHLDELPGDGRTQVGFICYDANIHFYLLGEGLTRPREMTVIDVDDIFLPSPESLLVNLKERMEMISDLLEMLPKRHRDQKTRVRQSALGAALQAAFKLMAPTGGRVMVMQTCLPNVGPGALTPREDPNARSSKDVAHLNPGTDFYKRLALECSGAQIAVDLFLASSQYSDLATLSGISKFSGGSVYYIPLFNAQREWQAEQLKRMLIRYFTRKIGFEAVMRVRCTRGVTIHTFHGNFFVRSTDLLSLPNVSPDAAFGMQLSIEESLSDLQQVCFQAALLYTSSKGERRIRVHTLCLPVANNLTDVLHSADQQCIIGLLTKMAVDRAQQSTLSDAREALINVAVDTLSAHRLAQNLPGGASGSLHAPRCLRLLCLYLAAILKHPAFRVGTSTRLDDRIAAMCDMKSLPLPQLLRSVYPELYPIHILKDFVPPSEQEGDVYPDPPRLHLSAERVRINGAYLLDDGETMILYICSAISPAYLLDTFGVSSFAELADEVREMPTIDTSGNELLNAFIEKLNEERPYASNILILKDTSPARKLFTDRLLDDRIDSTFAYYEFLQHVKSLIK